MIPDNETALDDYEAEQDRFERRRRRLELEEDLEPEQLPFYEEV
jgi:hypothetical protein